MLDAYVIIHITYTFIIEIHYNIESNTFQKNKTFECISMMCALTIKYIINILQLNKVWKLLVIPFFTICITTITSFKCFQCSFPSAESCICSFNVGSNWQTFEHTFSSLCQDLHCETDRAKLFFKNHTSEMVPNSLLF